jgi:hypothetical protein
MRLPDPSFRIPERKPRSFQEHRKPGAGSAQKPFPSATLLFVLVPLFSGCAPASPSPEQEIFWNRLEDGTPGASNTDYGGDTALPGSVWRQEFLADEFSVEAVPARASQLWYLEIRPQESFVYGLRREETGLRYRVEFDLTRPVEAPPPPWGG